LGILAGSFVSKVREAKFGHLLGDLRKPQRQRLGNVAKRTKGLMSNTMAVHVRYNSGYISLPSSAKQQRKMNKFCVVWKR